MTLVKNKPSATQPYSDPARVGTVTRQGVRIISEMSTPRILGYVALRHRVGLLSLTSFVLASYIVYDKAIRVFI
jgi:hypothetical protein